LVLNILTFQTSCHKPVIDTDQARELAKQAYFEIENHVFEPEYLDSASKKLVRAKTLNPNEPFVYVTTSYLILVSGYTTGDWYEEGTYSAGTIEKATAYAEKALNLDPEFPFGNAYMGRLLVLKKDYSKALKFLDKARKLDELNFYPWFFEGVLYEKLLDTEKSGFFFDEAKKRSSTNSHLILLNNHLQNLAKINHDEIKEEELLKENIRIEPDTPHFYGSYGYFLFVHKRYDEAVIQYEIAVKLGPYKQAEEMLDKAKALRNQTTKGNTIKSFLTKQHIYDLAGILPNQDISKFEEYLNYIFRESDIDIRFVFITNIENRPIEDIAIEKVQELNIGGRSREERGLLLLYDVSSKKLRVEVGYGLEPYFPDGFIGYLVHEHTQDYFSSGDLSLGLRLLLRMLHQRIREEVLGHTFDPRVTEIISHQRFLSGGAGVSSAMPGKMKGSTYWQSNMNADSRKNYLPQSNPEEVYKKYLQWLMAGEFDPKIEIFTSETQRYISSLPMTKAYFHYLLMAEYGRKYNVSTRGNTSLLYFTNDPLVCPHFFLKGDKGWQMDLVAEVNNTTNRVGGVYVWDYRGQNDVYTKTFSDKLINIKNYIRITDGDNRELPIRGSF
jgi:tetratricopeptide (TPR) repeat protein